MSAKLPPLSLDPCAWYHLLLAPTRVVISTLLYYKSRTKAEHFKRTHPTFRCFVLTVKFSFKKVYNSAYFDFNEVCWSRFHCPSLHTYQFKLIVCIIVRNITLYHPLVHLYWLIWLAICLCTILGLLGGRRMEIYRWLLTGLLCCSSCVLLSF
jgi:hypothetical protein